MDFSGFTRPRDQQNGNKKFGFTQYSDQSKKGKVLLVEWTGQLRGGKGKSRSKSGKRDQQSLPREVEGGKPETSRGDRTTTKMTQEIEKENFKEKNQMATLLISKWGKKEGRQRKNLKTLGCQLRDE